MHEIVLFTHLSFCPDLYQKSCQVFFCIIRKMFHLALKSPPTIEVKRSVNNYLGHNFPADELSKQGHTLSQADE